LGLIEIGGWSHAMVILDAMEKMAGIEVLQAELNDRPGVCLKVTGPLADIEAAMQAAADMAASIQTEIVTDIIAAPSEHSRAAYEAKPEVNPLIEQAVVQFPAGKEKTMNEQSSFAVGLIETQGFTAVFEAIDTAVKTANVEVLAREKLGGGYITVVIKGDVAAVRAAIDAGSAKVTGLGKLIAAHVIASPSKAVLSLLPIK
jgi:microcompartment protein CcmL/EutN